MILKEPILICLLLAFSMVVAPIDTLALSYIREKPNDYYNVEILTEKIVWEQQNESWTASAKGERVYDKWILWRDNYYLIDKDGIMVTGWFVSGNDDNNEFAFYFTADGKMGLYWQKIDGYWYYFHMGGFNKSGMHIVAGTKGTNSYYFNNEGQMLAGWKEVNSKWFYFDENSGMVNNWLKWKESWYFLGYISQQENEYIAAGEMRTGWLENNGKWYYLNISGAMQTGWIKYDGGWYFLDKTGGNMQTGWVQDSENWYFMNYDTGIMAANTWIGRYWVGIDGKWNPEAKS